MSLCIVQRDGLQRVITWGAITYTMRAACRPPPAARCLLRLLFLSVQCAELLPRAAKRVFFP